MYRSSITSALHNCRNIGWRFTSSTTSSTFNQVEGNNLEQNIPITETRSKNMPVVMNNPYQKEKQMCILCKYKITPDYKNHRLLSQFVSRFTGKIYERHITGLCKVQQRVVEREIFKARRAGLMPSYFREPRFAHDPNLYDPNNPFRPHRF